MQTRFPSRLRLPAISYICAVLFGSLYCVEARTAQGLQCPEAYEKEVLATTTAADAEILKSDDPVDLTMEIYEIINRLRVRQPGLSYPQVVNALISAYCPIVTKLPDLTDAQKLSRLMRFAALVQEKAPANSLAQGALILATTPLAPDVYRRLSAQAASVNQTATKFMAKILTDAAGQ
ncbi:hypothetical protein [Methylocapsa palsarum]|uniref:Uncharacterized protein n=1 Tax=Methylocapsa palsarum TaxID=1612308 RepID=A0A1I3X5F2_9HYPH|nr:hypothetical protein [Methylocapsa palsarum]SFK14790.1 hypothetical protein SAMN05444581_102365 [Methylocapsa palsarum]